MVLIQAAGEQTHFRPAFRKALSLPFSLSHALVFFLVFCIVLAMADSDPLYDAVAGQRPKALKEFLASHSIDITAMCK